MRTLEYDLSISRKSRPPDALTAICTLGDTVPQPHSSDQAWCLDFPQSKVSNRISRGYLAQFNYVAEILGWRFDFRRQPVIRAIHEQHHRSGSESHSFGVEVLVNSENRTQIDWAAFNELGEQCSGDWRSKEKRIINKRESYL